MVTKQALKNKTALVAGGTRGAGRGIAVELGAAGATVYVTGRSTENNPSEYNRPETIEETAGLVNEAGGIGIPVKVDHLIPEEVRKLAHRIMKEKGHLDILINDIWGGENLVEWNVPIWDHSLEKGLRLLDLAIETHLITNHFILPLLIRKKGGLVVEMTDGTMEYNENHYRLSVYYDLAKTSVTRLAWALAHELEPHHCTAVALTPGWMRSEMMLDHFGVSEDTWKEALGKDPHFAISETPRFTGRAVVHLAIDPENGRWNGRSLSSGQLAVEYGFTDVDGSRPDCFRYMKEIVETGKSPDVTGYR